MAFLYHPPETVLNPAKYIRKTKVLYDGGDTGFSLAIIDWEGLEHMGMRWNVAFKEQCDVEKQNGNIRCHGSPALKGVPSWFILPRELFHPSLFNSESSHFLDLIKSWPGAPELRDTSAAHMFNSCAAAYQDKFMELELYHDTFDLLCNHLNLETAAVLDVACGPGNIARYLLSKQPGYRITGIDLAENMVTLARNNNPGATFEVMDCRDISKLTDKYNAVVIGFCMPYLNEAEVRRLVTDAHNLLVPGGYIYISTMIEDGVNQSGYKKSSSGEHELFIYYHKTAYVKETLLSAGFAIVECCTKDYKGNDGVVNTDLVLIGRT